MCVFVKTAIELKASKTYSLIKTRKSITYKIYRGEGNYFFSFQTNSTYQDQKSDRSLIPRGFHHHSQSLYHH